MSGGSGDSAIAKPSKHDPIDPETGELLEPGQYSSGPRTGYVISPFTWQKKGKARGFVKLPELMHESKAAAFADAGTMVALGKWMGAIVVEQTSGNDAGGNDELVVLARVGWVPEEL